MKATLAKAVRKVFPARATRALEDVYRRSRVKLVSARFGNPAKSLRVIAITGTNGKTTTLAYLNEILKEAGRTTAMFGTATIEIAGQTKLNELNMTVSSTADMQRFLKKAKKSKVDFVLLEVTSHALDQHKLSTVPIEMAIMTNLTHDHLEYHGGMEHYAAAKAKLFQGRPQYIVLNQDDDWFDYFNQFEAGEHKITYGTAETAEARIVRVKLFKKGSEVALEIDHQTKLELATNLPGKYNAYNLTAAVSAAYLLGVDLDSIIEGAANLEGVPGRFERPVEGLPYDVIVDYAHTADALEKLLEAVRQSTKNRIILVFGACGDRDKAKRPIMGGIAVRMTDRIIVTEEESYNEDPVAIREAIMQGIKAEKGSAKAEEVADRREAIVKALKIARPGDSVVITGMGHEQFRMVQGKQISWNDSAAVREILEAKTQNKSDNLQKS